MKKSRRKSRIKLVNFLVMMLAFFLILVGWVILNPLDYLRFPLNPTPPAAPLPVNPPLSPRLRGEDKEEILLAEGTGVGFFYSGQITGHDMSRYGTLQNNSDFSKQEVIATQFNSNIHSNPEEIAKINIGMSAAFSGSSKALGIELYRGSMAYIEQVNRTGGIQGKPISIRVYDDGYNPIPTIKNTIQLVEKDKVFLLFNYVGTPTVTRMLPLLTRYRDRHVYLFFPFTGAQPQRQEPYQKFVFNLRASYQQETEGLVDNFIQIGRKRIAVFYQVDAFGRSGWDGVKRGLAKYGLKMVGEATYRRGTPYSANLQQQVEILRQTHPDAIISIGAYAACAAFIRDARDAGWDIPIANISFVGSESLLKNLQETGNQTGKNYTENLINSQVVPSYENTALPAVREYRQLMQQYNPMLPADLKSEDYEPLPYSFVSFEGFLNAKLLVEILKRTKENTTQLPKVVESIQNLDLGIDAPVSFKADKHQGLDRVYYTTIENGRFVPLTNWQPWAK